jgi:hypothetical protein
MVKQSEHHSDLWNMRPNAAPALPRVDRSAFWDSLSTRFIDEQDISACLGL